MKEQEVEAGCCASRRIYAVDTGSTLKSQAFAWARTNPEPSEVIGSNSIQHLVEGLSIDLRQGISVALGFEAPLFLPIPADASNLSRGRLGDGNRSCFAPAGGYVATLALQQAAWILRELKGSCRSSCRFTLDRAHWPPRNNAPLLFCWEAFVSGHAHAAANDGDAHIRDAATAARYFAEHEDRLVDESRVTAEHPLSMIGTAALWSGWSSDLGLLKQPSLVLRPAVPYTGAIQKIWV